MCVRERERETKYVRERGSLGERGKETERVCVFERERETERQKKYMCVCLCERERERE